MIFDLVQCNDRYVVLENEPQLMFVCLFVVGHLIAFNGGAGVPKLKLSLKLIPTHRQTELNSSATDTGLDRSPNVQPKPQKGAKS